MATCIAIRLVLLSSFDAIFLTGILLAVPHASSSPDIYNGYYIPKGSIVVGNAWGLLHDPTVYPEPEKFIPERYLTEDGKKLREDIPDPVAAFGFGRR